VFEKARLECRQGSAGGAALWSVACARKVGDAACMNDLNFNALN
jgi:hypothetical protein